ncbi:MAG: hypothetical protein NTX22_07530 [Ignavibacteriales bacterium]|nr:hypothetical protein [Ignavibacteriales bacterium]
MQELNLFAIYTDILNRNKIEYFITGSVASIVYGEPRMTHDIDLVINLVEKQAESFYNLFPMEQFYCPPMEIIRTEVNRYARGQLNIIHHDTGFKADIYFAGQDGFQKWAMENKKELEFLGTTIYIAPPEYVIVKKLEFFKEGGSQKHISDIKSILNYSKEIIDSKFLNNKIREMELEKIWEKYIT